MLWIAVRNYDHLLVNFVKVNPYKSILNIFLVIGALQLLIAVYIGFIVESASVLPEL